jgi:hypothetical protein
MKWRGDADGDVLRNLEGGGIDCSEAARIDFDIEFEIRANP